MDKCPLVDADGNVGEGEGIEDGGSPRTKAKTAGDKDNQDARRRGRTPTILTNVQQVTGKRCMVVSEENRLYKREDLVSEHFYG